MSKYSEHIGSILAQLPEQPGVYQYFDREGTIIYVGKAKNLKRRVSSYFQKEQEWIKTRHLVEQIRDIKYVVVATEQDAFLLENNLIKQYQPKYNILLKDGKSYPSICITKEDYPRIFKTRKIVKGAGEYFGPYSYGNTVDLVLELIHELFPIRTCTMQLTENGVEKGKYRVCLKYHLNKCCGVCAGEAGKQTYNEYINEAKKIIRGDAHEIGHRLQEQMQALSAQMEYEQAAEIKRKYDLLEKFCSRTIITNSSVKDLDVFGYDEQGERVYINMLHVHNGSIVQGQTIEYRKRLDETKEQMLSYGILELREQLHSSTSEILVPFLPDEISETLHYNIAVNGDKKKLLELAMQNVRQYKADVLKQQDKLNPDQRAIRVLTALQNACGLSRIPMFIDSFDNSHIQGSNAVGGCVVFRKAKASKSDYKRFNIRHPEGGDDYESMREVVRRRYTDLQQEGQQLPDLIIADGGIGQMYAIREVVVEQLGLDIPIAGLKKDDKHRTNTLLVGWPVQEVGLKVTDEVFRLLVEIQNEVHRFAISYHKNKRSKSQTHSELDDIQGVGPTTKSKLLQHFGSVNQIRLASLEDIKQILTTKTASAVYEHFHPDLSR